jgi:aerobic carbon-monoxide dehydrogenase large subunit
MRRDAANALVGSPIERMEDPRFLRGRGQYVDELTREGVLHAAILRSQIAHGAERLLDVSAALALPGVRAVLTAREIGSPTPVIPLRLWPMPELELFGQPVIADCKVRYVGEALAVVLADPKAIAEDA